MLALLAATQELLRSVSERDFASDAALGMEAKPQKKKQCTAQFTVLRNRASAFLVIRKTSF